jgi:hypothetical protein
MIFQRAFRAPSGISRRSVGPHTPTRFSLL